MQFAGIDIGSRTIELVVVNRAGKILHSVQTDTGFDPLQEAANLINGVNYDYIMKKFEMNDRCAAGTGKFLEIMARTLGFTIEDFGREALLAEKDLNISSMCTVFAESEVTSLIAKGNNRREIARGLHTSVIRRAAGMINRVSSQGDIVFTGGVAKNPCMHALLTEKLGRNVLVPQNPHLVGALGAALLAIELNQP